MTDLIQQRVRTAVQAALDKKAFDLNVLAVSELTSIADYFVLCSANTERQTQAIADSVMEKVRSEASAKPRLVEGATPGRWILLDHDVNILLLGESGGGKDYFAEAIHECGKRREKPLVRIDCAAIPADLFEAEIFGFEKGTFTDAVARKVGKLEMAQGGTIYFDAVTALTPNLQAKLLRAIQERQFTRLGGHDVVPFDSRMISSSSTSVDSLRNDLLYRINIVTLTIPPLRERREDIPQLAKGFVARRKRGIDDAAMRMLMEH